MGSLSILRRPLRYRFYNATIVLIAVNVLVFFLSYVAPSVGGYLGLTPVLVVRAGAWWQVFTYMFVHGGFSHILFNMLTLFLFGIQLEHLIFYFFSGVGAGLFTLAVNWYTGIGMIRVVGASGAIFGLLLAFAAFFPDSSMFLFGILPMRTPVAVLVFIGLELFFQFTNLASGVAHLTHLAGFGFAALYLSARMRLNPFRIFFRRR
jgi:membrane associated rhomboid family serine protease